MKINKKGMSMIVVSMIIGLVIILFAIPMVNYIKKTSDTSMTKDWNIKPDDEFKPYDYGSQVKGDDAIALKSINALISAINTLANGEILNKYQNQSITSTNITNYRITYTSQIHIEDQTGAFNLGDHYPTWSFTQKKDIKLKSSKINELLIYSDYYLNWCSNSDTEKKECSFLYDQFFKTFISCKCDKSPDQPYGDNFKYLPESKRIAAENKGIAQVREINKVIKIKLEVNYKNGESCVVETQNTNLDLLLGKKYSSQNNCLESPIWLECKGIKISYCGSQDGFLGNNMMSSNYYLFDKNNNIHSSAGAYFITNIDDIFNQNRFSRTISSISETNVMGVTLNQQSSYGAKPSSLNMQNFNSQDNCVNGAQIGNLTLKCTGIECNLCNFELPQNITKDSALDYIAGYGDPKYVLYYEGFPIGEDGSWMVNQPSLGLTTIVMEDAFFALGGALASKTKLLGRIFLPSKAASKGTTEGAKVVAESLTQGLVKSGALGFRKILLTSPDYLKRMVRRIAEKRNWESVYIITDDLVKAESKNLDDLVKLIEKDDSMKLALQDYSEAAVKSGAKSIADRGLKYSTAFFIASLAYDADMQNQKFKVIGFDNIGLKIENNPTSISGQSAIEDLNDLSSKYYIVLTKDKYMGIKSNYQRFYLASPCKADLKIYQTECSCEKPKGSEEAFAYYNYDTNEWNDKPFINGNQILVSKSGINEQTKELDFSKTTKLCDTFENNLYATKTAHVKTPCIIIEPTIKDGYCFAGNDYSTAIGVAGVGANLVVTVGLNAAFPGLGALASFGSQVAIDAATAVITNMATSRNKWPAHP